MFKFEGHDIGSIFSTVSKTDKIFLKNVLVDVHVKGFGYQKFKISVLSVLFN